MAPRYCSSCKKKKSWETHHKTCPDCRERVNLHNQTKQVGGMDRTAMRSNALRVMFTAEMAQEMVEHARAGLRDDHLAMILRISPECYEEWRERGRRAYFAQRPILRALLRGQQGQGRDVFRKIERNGGTLPSVPRPVGMDAVGTTRPRNPSIRALQVQMISQDAGTATDANGESGTIRDIEFVD